MKKSTDYEYGVLSAVALNFYEGYVRLCNARVAALSAMVAMHEVHGPELPAKDNHKLWKIVDCLSKVEYGEYDSFSYLSYVIYLVYGTTLFDCFLSEITRFLFLRNPCNTPQKLGARLRWICRLAEEKAGGRIDDGERATAVRGGLQGSGGLGGVAGGQDPGRVGGRAPRASEPDPRLEEAVAGRVAGGFRAAA